MQFLRWVGKIFSVWWATFFKSLDWCIWRSIKDFNLKCLIICTVFFELSALVNIELSNQAFSLNIHIISLLSIHIILLLLNIQFLNILCIVIIIFKIFDNLGFHFFVRHSVWRIKLISLYSLSVVIFLYLFPFIFDLILNRKALVV